MDSGGLTLSSSGFVWHLERHDEMHATGIDPAGGEGLLVYDLHQARSLIVENPREVRVLRVSTLVPARWPPDGPREDMDPAFPLILGTEGGQPLILDGFHRLARARQMGIETVNAVVLTEAETGQIRSFRPFAT
jgi:hypothetical protein